MILYIPILLLFLCVIFKNNLWTLIQSFGVKFLHGRFFFLQQGFQSGPVPGTFTRLRSCIVPAEITEPPKN
jgi:hypothetical protein